MHKDGDAVSTKYDRKMIGDILLQHYLFEFDPCKLCKHPLRTSCKKGYHFSAYNYIRITSDNEVEVMGCHTLYLAFLKVDID